MSCTPETVKVEDDGRDVYLPDSDCSLVLHWKTKYEAKLKVAWIPKGGGLPLLYDADWKPTGQLSTKGPTVWAVPSPTIGAYRDAVLIQRLVSPASAWDYQESRRNLSDAGYPDDALDAVPPPKYALWRRHIGLLIATIYLRHQPTTKPRQPGAKPGPMAICPALCPSLPLFSNLCYILWHNQQSQSHQRRLTLTPPGSPRPAPAGRGTAAHCRSGTW